MDTVTLTVDGLSIEDLARVAIEGAPLILDAGVEARIAASRAVVERVLASGRLVYGLNTGLGHARDERISDDLLAVYQGAMVAGHAAGIGPPLSDTEVRALIVARVAGIARGGSGAHPDVARTLVAMLNAGVHPLVPSIGSVGASDLTQMAAIAMIVIGRGQARLDGAVVPGAEALARAGIAPCALRPKDGLALISANGASIGLGALAVLEAERLSTLADLTAALSLEVIGGNLSPFDPDVAAAKPVVGQIAAAAAVRAALAGSYLHDPDRAPSVQDRLSFRTIPQVHGGWREQIAAARRAVELELNAMDDNPLVLIERDTMLSNGNFHPMALALHFDALRVGLAHVAMLSERRLSAFIRLEFGNPEQQGIISRSQGYAATGMLAYSAAAVVSGLKQRALPVTLGCPPLDHGTEDHATLAPLAVAATCKALADLELVLAIEALLCTDALDALPSLPRSGTGTGALYRRVRAALDSGAADTPASVVVDAVVRGLRDPLP